MMFGMKPDVHHIRKFGSLAYVHVPDTSGRRKHDNNAKIGFVLGYEEDVVGCKVYFPEEHTAKFVSDLRVAEDVVYKDRHDNAVDEDDLESLHFTRREDQDVEQETTLEMATSGTQSMFSEQNSVRSVELVGGEVDVVIDRELEKGVKQVDTISKEQETRQDDVGSTRELSREVLAPEIKSDGHGDEASRGESVVNAHNLSTSVLESDVASDSGDQRTDDSLGNQNDDVESVAGTRGSSVADNVGDDEEEGSLVDDDITVASVFSFAEKAISMESDNMSSATGLEEDLETSNGLVNLKLA
ncbi:Putative Retroelement pol Polyprotein [Phytophthora palmivora]|uniref:Retroelement pol Polyprotein n=1 Tax=Phytophthora palmivora TaxID=4796 RepID=A0A2P4YH78_9STRA|nr:Putative Retroelement pol Polyprotein [Phytophthora palmivora]